MGYASNLVEKIGCATWYERPYNIPSKALILVMEALRMYIYVSALTILK